MQGYPVLEDDDEFAELDEKEQAMQRQLLQYPHSINKVVDVRTREATQA